MRPPRFRIRTLMIAVAAVACFIADASLATLVLLVAASGVALRTLVCQRVVSAPARRRPTAYLLTLAFLYVPFGWVLWEWCWDRRQVFWLQLWPVLPGFVAGLFAHPDDTAMTRIAGGTSLLIIAAFTALGSSGRAALMISSLVALLGACLASYLVYGFHLL